MASSRGQIAAWRADVWSHLRNTVRIDRKSAARTVTLVFNRARTCLHGDAPVCLKLMTCLISASVNPRSRALVRNFSVAMASEVYARYPDTVRAGRGRIPRAS